MTTKLPLAPIKRIAVEGGAQRIGIPAAEIIGLAAEEWIKRITLSAEKYAIHAGRKTVKPEDVAVVVRDMGINIQIAQNKPKHKLKKLIESPPVSVIPPAPVTEPVVVIPKPQILTQTNLLPQT
jgi:histone H3/H4